MLLCSTGTLVYQSEPEKKLVLTVDPELSRFYRSLIPARFVCNRPKFPPHITVVRKEAIHNVRHWNRYAGQVVDFSYDPYVHHDGVYWWLNVACPRLTEIRTELGLQPWTPLVKPPSGVEWFHTTIGNCK